MVTDITRYLQIWGAVGKDAANLQSDVGHIQVLLRLLVKGGAPSAVDGNAGPTSTLVNAITDFQRVVMKIAPDGRVEPSSETFRAQLDKATPQIHEQIRFPAGTGHRAHLRDADYAHAASILGCKAEAIKAISEVESKGAPFLHSAKPKILFEPQVFGDLTFHRYDGLFPEVSRRLPLPRGHGVHDYGSMRDQWVKLKVTALLDRSAAIGAASWADSRFSVRTGRTQEPKVKRPS